MPPSGWRTAPIAGCSPPYLCHPLEYQGQRPDAPFRLIADNVLILCLVSSTQSAVFAAFADTAPFWRGRLRRDYVRTRTKTNSRWCPDSEIRMIFISVPRRISESKDTSNLLIPSGVLVFTFAQSPISVHCELQNHATGGLSHI